MKKPLKLLIAFLCFAAGILLNYFESELMIIDEEYTGFIAGALMGAGASILIFYFFNPKKSNTSHGN